VAALTRRTLLAGAAGSVAAAALPAVVTAGRPDILVIVADDLAFADLGAFGGEIATPNLDRLAAAGHRLDRFHTAPTCSPSRAMLLTGLDAHRAGLGTMEELVTPAQRASPAYRGRLSPDTGTLAETLRSAGWHTLHAGKWHLGSGPAELPTARGFARSFGLMEAGHNHFGQDAGRGATYVENGRPIDRLPADFYSSSAFADWLIREIGSAPEGAPLFSYLAFTAPHWPLMAPAEAIAAQRGRYDAGWEVLRESRIARQRALGIVPADAPAAPLELPPGGQWDRLPPAARAAAARRMEIHAAMVTEMDRQVGRVVAALEAAGRWERTILFFMSDNGPDAIDLERAAAFFAAAHAGQQHFEAPLPGTPTADAPPPNAFAAAVAGADNRLENLGGASSWAAYGHGWAQAGNGLLKLWKAFPTEGGTRVPAILRVPGGKSGRVAADLDVRDLFPTLIDLAGLPPTAPPTQQFAGRSWAPLLAGRASGVRGADDALGHELFGARSLRMGGWKLLDLGDGRWQLYDLDTDPGETTDRAAAEPERVAAMAARWASWAQAAGVILPDRPIPMLVRPGQPPPGKDRPAMPPPGAQR
jgi:arylsulfatase